MQIRKGQIFTSDSIIALTLFLTLIIISLSLIDRQINNLIEQEERNKAINKAFQIADFLVRTEGYPKNWNSSNVKLIGLAYPDHVLQTNKINEMSNITYEELKIKLKVEPYNFLLTINSTGNNYSIGRMWNENTTLIVVEERSILINDSNSLERGIMRLYLWQ